jgi:peptidase YpeB-like protein
MKRRALAICIGLVIGSVASGEHLPCTIPASKDEKKEDLAAKARIHEDAARASALKAVSASPGKATVKEAELEVESGCLVYSFDIRVEGERGVREVLVDAGDGKILKTEREDESREAKEKDSKH